MVRVLKEATVNQTSNKEINESENAIPNSGTEVVISIEDEPPLNEDETIIVLEHFIDDDIIDLETQEKTVELFSEDGSVNDSVDEASDDTEETNESIIICNRIRKLRAIVIDSEDEAEQDSKEKQVQSDSDPVTPPRIKLQPTPNQKTENFTKNRIALAQDYYKQFNQKILNNLLPSQLSITWSKKLKSTAGKAIYDPRDTSNRRIELSYDLLDSEYKLLNTLAHEMCHMCVFYSGILGENSHGKTFKIFANMFNASKEFKDVQVSITHNYETKYKYSYECEKDCGYRIERHSKSIDIVSTLCICGNRLILKNAKDGSLVGKVVEVKEGVFQSISVNKDGTPKKLNGYSSFVKSNFSSVKKEINATSNADVMKILGQKWKQLSIS